MPMRRVLTLSVLAWFLGGCAMQPSQVPDQEQPPATVAAASDGALSTFFPFSLFADEDEDEEGVSVAEIDEEDSNPLADLVLDTGAEGDEEDIRAQLYEQLKEWHAVRYKLGGQSKKGIDCSGFVQLTYRDRFGVDLPRDTSQQARVGESIDKTELQPGDLVFFHVNRRTRHVGIYVEDGKFLHASSKKGVTLSRLDDRYWKPRYWKAVRLD